MLPDMAEDVIVDPQQQQQQQQSQPQQPLLAIIGAGLPAYYAHAERLHYPTAPPSVQEQPAMCNVIEIRSRPSINEQQQQLYEQAAGWIGNLAQIPPPSLSQAQSPQQPQDFS